LLSRAPGTALRIFDINLRQRFYSREVINRSLELANVLKLNEDELPVVAGMFQISGDWRQQIKSLVDAFELNVVVFTSGARGSVIYKEGCWSEQPALPVLVADTVGAGDAFTATLAMGILHDMELCDLHRLASDVSSYVCSQSGATPSLPAALRNRLHSKQKLR